MNISDLELKDFAKYLKIYNANIDWAPHLEDLYNQLKKKIGDASMAKYAARKQAAFSILYPAIDTSAITDPPFKLLFYAGKNNQFDSRDWDVEFCKVIEEDHSIKLIREVLVGLGTIDPIYFIPRWRQAFARLIDEVERSGLIVDQSANRVFEFFVKCYGGTIINSFFGAEYVKQINKIPNWRTPYFFERMIHKVYKKDQLIKIKTLDIEEIRGADGSRIKEIKLSTDRKEEVGGDDF